METTVSTKGQAVIPEAIREQARIRPGDRLDVGYVNGLVILRKRKPLTGTEVNALILSGRDLPPMTPADEAAVEEIIHEVRRERKA